MTVNRGRIDKRQAILDAAFTVFARDGYRQASVDTVAATAGVAKHTIYNHFGDKESLFRAAVAALADDALARNLAAVASLRPDRDPAEALTEVGRKLAECYCDEKSWALRRLLHAELASMPELQDLVRERATDKVNDALADRLARIALAGHLRITDPAVAAEQFGALLTAPFDTRSRLGTRKVPAKELAEVTQNAVQTFLRAYRAEP
ncbi:MAG TPA: TetR/AcrR family transcriptional regulator [Kribbella sp.]